jgi:formylglycine-generating enzyme required for sulfatase activity
MNESPSPWRKRMLVVFCVLGPLGLLPYFFHTQPPDVPDRARVCLDPFCVAEMVRIPAGEQLLGAQATDPSGLGFDADASPDEAPVRRPQVAVFYLDRHLVTVAEYMDCVAHCGCKSEGVATGGFMNFGASGRENHPMNGVGLGDARAYCAWIGARLPSETEWERAARGPNGRRFPWGDEIPACNDRGDGTTHEACPYEGTRPVGDQIAESPFGVRGLAGGLWEWTTTPYASDGSSWVQKGGGWSSEDMMDRRAAFRGGLAPKTRLADVGFRCARSGDAGAAAASHERSAASRCHSPRQ